MKLSSRNKLVLIISGLVLSAGAAGILFSWLTLHITSITADLEAIESKLAILEYERNNIRQIEDSLEEKKPLVTRFHTILVDHNRPIAFLESLTELGKTTGNKITLDYSEQESNQESLVFRLTIEGSASSTAKYLKLLELMPYAITVEHINWQSLAQNSGEQTADTRMLITIRVRSKL
ncbi:MAG: hypothetical protein HYT37_03715 [Candidatus Sungbacteria bacterium]|nr:hypothetical protein [Candidatus Sungbacteria bacterium]